MSLDDYLETPEERLEYEQRKSEMVLLHRESSPFCIEHYIKKGFDGESAQQELDKMRTVAHEELRRRSHPSSAQFYTNKGIDNDTAFELAKEFRIRTGRVPTKSGLIKKWGEEEGTRRWLDHRSRMDGRGETYLSRFDDRREAMMMQTLVKGFGYSRKCALSYDDFTIYSDNCRKLTKLVLRAYSAELDPTHLKLGKDYGKDGYHVDHQFSVYGGFFHRVDPMKICALQNLRIITASENSQKSQFCTITLAEVLNFKTILEEEWLSDECKGRIKDVYC